MAPIILIALHLLRLYTLVLILRVILDWVMMFARSWQPRGIVLVIANLVYTLTDPPLNWLDRKIPALRMGNVGFSMGFIVLYFAIVIVQRVLLSLLRVV
ncbi:YggT family protein [Actinomyces vulturis]|uniref:YggT family protein n=1 Tax=Actinomyces vulturis TaxID=1857645 RepID=UPI00082B1998|nr:YggT family protein [Actinomyces vulturis]